MLGTIWKMLKLLVLIEKMNYSGTEKLELFSLSFLIIFLLSAFER